MAPPVPTPSKTPRTHPQGSVFLGTWVGNWWKAKGLEFAKPRSRGAVSRVDLAALGWLGNRSSCSRGYSGTFCSMVLCFKSGQECPSFILLSPYPRSLLPPKIRLLGKEMYKLGISLNNGRVSHWTLPPHTHTHCLGPGWTKALGSTGCMGRGLGRDAGTG